jgi:ABC-type sulfate transport system permease component
MAKRADSTKEWKPKHKVAFSFVGLTLAGFGSLTLLSGKFPYRNYWQAPGFAPFAIVIAMLAIAAPFTVRYKNK